MADDRGGRGAEDSMRVLVALSEQRTRMGAERSYMNAERTLSVWVRTAMAAMIFGLALDRFGLLVRGLSQQPATLSTIAGGALVVFSVLMAVSAGLRFVLFARQYGREFPFPAYHTAWLPAAYAFMVAVFGVVVAVLLWVVG